MCTDILHRRNGADGLGSSECSGSHEFRSMRDCTEAGNPIPKGISASLKFLLISKPGFDRAFSLSDKRFVANSGRHSPRRNALKVIAWKVLSDLLPAEKH